LRARSPLLCAKGWARARAPGFHWLQGREMINIECAPENFLKQPASAAHAP